MKNIKEYLGSEEKEISLYHSNGEAKLIYFELLCGYWSESTYDSNCNRTSRKDSSGYWSESTYDSNGNELTFKSSSGTWYESTYDSKGNKLTYKDSFGYWSESTYDSNGNELTYKNSGGTSRGFDIEEMTMDQVCKALGKEIKIKK